MAIQDPPSTEMDDIIKKFGSGLYAWLTFSNFIGLNMAWQWNISNADNGISDFKNQLTSLVNKVKAYKTGLHVILVYGMSRDVDMYQEAKTEDIRNAQWFNDNNLATKEHTQGGIGGYVYTTFSRYARKLRTHLEAKVKAGFKFLESLRQNNLDVPLVISAPGEAELNATRLNDNPVLQKYFCDYSPFAVLEFRDWIKHEGMYANGGRYHGDGYSKGGSRYQGSTGLQHFNVDFGTSFTTWDLKYFNWKLTDPVDSSLDPNIIPFTQYSYGGMMKPSGPHGVPGGFDPPRQMKNKGDDRFWDVFQEFREAMVHHLVKDMAATAVAAGFKQNQYYSHQIPADYLWGTRPNDPAMALNARYYASASALRTANALTGTGMGITMYDVFLTTHYGRTSRYAVPAISAMSGNWGALEYNPDVIFSDNIEDIDTVPNIYEQIKRLYDYNAHTISFFKWGGELRYRFKDTNREAAAKQFFDAVKDKARQPVDRVFKPPRINGFKGNYNESGDEVVLSWSSKIWTSERFWWTVWGDFKEFVVYRGYTATFLCEPAAEITRTRGFTFRDKTFLKAGDVYYKICASNKNNEKGDPAGLLVKVPGSGLPVLEVSRVTLYFGSTTAGVSTPAQVFSIRNSGSGVMVWSLQSNVNWVSCKPASGANASTISVTVDGSGKAAGTYTGTITITAANALNSPRTVAVTLRVYRPAQLSPPFGTFETPAQESRVSGSIAVTGWALDDIGVESVKIFRKEGSVWAYVGDAVFMEGTRPDVAAVYSTFPFNTRGGWGYLLLTNLLPGGGNGAYQLKAVAKSFDGRETVLGIRTIIGDNDHSMKPFGAIDTPAQGGIATGSSYVNFGWALTPQPNKIPENGSTIDVYIDGVKVGNPVYNRYRKDIATLFPNYANSNGAVGYLYINTLNYEDGMHTISWTVRDNAGNTEGIGSRYFFIKNDLSS